MSQEEDVKKILKKLEEIDRRLKKLEKPADEKKIEVKPKKGKPEYGVKKLAEKIKVSEEDVWKVFDVEENCLTLVKIVGEGDKEKTKNATLLVLLGYKYIFGIDDVLSQEIRKNVAENKIPLNAFANHIKEIIPSLIRRKGKPRSPKTTYKLTTPGEVKARDLLKQIYEDQK